MQHQLQSYNFMHHTLRDSWQTSDLSQTAWPLRPSFETWWKFPWLTTLRFCMPVKPLLHGQHWGLTPAWEVVRPTWALGRMAMESSEYLNGSLQWSESHRTNCLNNSTQVQGPRRIWSSKKFIFLYPWDWNRWTIDDFWDSLKTSYSSEKFLTLLYWHKSLHQSYILWSQLYTQLFWRLNNKFMKPFCSAFCFQ